MSVKQDITTSRPVLTSAAKILYRRLLAGDCRHEHSTALQQLIDAHLAAPDPVLPGHYQALDATAAMHRLQAQLQLAATSALHDAALLPGQFHDVTTAYQAANPGRSGTCHEYVVGDSEINSRLEVLVGSCTSELLTAQNRGPRSAELLAKSYSRDIGVLARGARMRTLYLPSVRNDGPTARWAQTMTEQGAEIRTSTMFGRTIIIDRRVALVPMLAPWEGPGNEPPRAIFLKDEGIVRVIVAAFERDWQRAEPWDGSMTGITIPATHRSVLECFSRGLDQTEIASELGMSKRTVAGWVAELKEITGCRTVAQLMFWWAARQDTI